MVKSRSICKFCHRKATHLHAHHGTDELEPLFEIHYAKWNPESVILRFRDAPPWRISERKLLLEELRKYFSEEEIREALERKSWFIKLVNKEKAG